MPKKNNIFISNMHMTPLNIYASDEAAFEDQCIKILPKIIQTQFPDKDFHCFVFREKLINFYLGSMEPDVMVIAKDFTYWAVIEVETVDLMNESKPPGHTMRQLERMAGSDISRQPEIFDKINEKNPSLKLSKKHFLKMQRNIPPDFVCICNKFLKEWEDVLRPFGIWLVSAQEFRPNGDPNNQTNQVFHVELGDYSLKREKFKVKWNYFFFISSDKGFIKYFEDNGYYEIEIKNHKILFLAQIKNKKLKLMPKSSKFRSLISDEDKTSISELIVLSNSFVLK